MLIPRTDQSILLEIKMCLGNLMFWKLLCQDSISNSVKRLIPLCYLRHISHQPNVNVLYWET